MKLEISLLHNMCAIQCACHYTECVMFMFHIITTNKYFLKVLILHPKLVNINSFIILQSQFWVDHESWKGAILDLTEIALHFLSVLPLEADLVISFTYCHYMVPNMCLASSRPEFRMVEVFNKLKVSAWQVFHKLQETAS